MKLFLVKRIEDTDWDEYQGHVIRAETEERARQMASESAGDEGRECWISNEQTICQELSADGVEEIIISDFHAG